MKRIFNVKSILIILLSVALLSFLVPTLKPGIKYKEAPSGDTSFYSSKEWFYENGGLQAMEIIVAQTRVKLTWHQNGKISGKAQFYNEMPVGTFNTWHKNGQKNNQGNYQKYNDTIGFQWKTVTETVSFDGFVNISDKKEEIMNYNTIGYKYPRTGEWKYWYADGQLKQISNYKTYKPSEINPIEVKEGKWQFFNKAGSLIKEVEYQSDKIIK